jgi:hypothetical protein
MGAHKLLCARVGIEDRSDMQSVDCIARGGLRTDRVADEGGLVGDSHPEHKIFNFKICKVFGYLPYTSEPECCRI